MVDFHAVNTTVALVRETMNPEVAKVIRSWRVTKGWSFQTIARHYHEHYDPRIKSGDAQDGIVIVQQAATLCNERSYDPPWSYPYHKIA